MITPKYVGFTDRDDVAREFQEGIGSRYDASVPFRCAEGFPTDTDILYAAYNQDFYEGDAFVLFKKGQTLYEVNGSHCSCMGLEGQWEPEETTWAALAIRQPSDYGGPAVVIAEAQKRIKRTT